MTIGLSTDVGFVEILLHSIKAKKKRRDADDYD
jgi:hypothetical protein